MRPRVVRGVAVAAALAACTPLTAVEVTPSLPVGTTARYAFTADVTTRLAQDEVRSVRSTLAGTIELTVISEGEAGRTIRIRFEPTTSTRDGEPTNPGPAQVRDVVLAPDGSVGGVSGTQIGEAELDEESLATLLFPAVPAGPLDPGDRWSIDRTEGRLSALGRDDGRNVAELDLRRDRPLTVERVLDGRTVQLEGVEQARTILRWDLEAGRPLSASVRSHAELEVRAGALRGGSISIDASTRVTAI